MKLKIVPYHFPKNTLLISKFLHLFFIISLFQYQAEASHLIGGDVSYRHLGGLKYEITCKLYRDCRGVPLMAPSSAMFGNATKLKTLSLTLVSIRDISNYCKKSGNPCYPQNTSSNLGIEEHTYLDTVDFNKADSAFKQYCSIQFGVGQCCRPGDITTGGSNNDFWVFSTLDICKAPNNSSPVFGVVPNVTLCCFQTVFYNNGGMDTLDRDSLSYEMAEPMTSWSGKVSYSGSFSYTNPFSVYYPAGYNKAKGPNASANPPIGFSFDRNSGIMIFVPTDCNERTNAAVKIKEWRKDSSGTYQLIGEVRRDMVFTVKSCPDNNPPTITNKVYNYNICPNQKLCFDVTVDDKQFIPPPPAKANPPDTVSLFWNYGIGRGAKFTVNNTNARLQTGQFCWTPKDSDASDIPYVFAVTARDNMCPINGIAVRSFEIKVSYKAKASWTKKHIKNGLYEIKATLDKNFKGTAQYYWEFTDSAFKISDSLYYFYPSFRKVSSNKQIDTVQFYKGGKYILHLRINNSPFNCPTDYFDTVRVAPVTPILSIYPSGLVEKWVCENDLDTIRPLVKNAKKPIRYKWSSSMADTLPYIVVKHKKDTSFRVDVRDSAGYHQYAEWNIKLNLNPILIEKKNVTICKGDTVSISGDAKTYKDTLLWKWELDGSLFANTKTIRVTKTGTYVLKISDATSCFSQPDTMLVSHDIQIANRKIKACIGDTVALSAILSNDFKVKSRKWFFEGKQIGTDSILRIVVPGKYVLEFTDSNNCISKRDTLERNNWMINVVGDMVKRACIGDSMFLVATGSDTSKGKKGHYYWHENSVSRVLIDSGTTITYPFKQDGSLVVVLKQQEGLLTCYTSDTVEVSFRPLPEIILDKATLCQNEIELDLHSIILKPSNASKGIVNWTLLKTLKKPNGMDNSLSDLVYDKDTSSKVHYFLKADKMTIDLKTKFRDSVMLGLVYKDEFGCKNTSSNDAVIVIRSNVEVSFIQNEQKRCYGDSLLYLSNDFGVNYYGGKWFTHNDSSSYSKWPQGNKVQLAEKLGTQSLDSKGGKYLLTYVLENNNCLSSGSTRLTIIAYPQIAWIQSDVGSDSIAITDKTTNAEKREWYINGKLMGENSVLKVSKGDAKFKIIELRVYNFKCKTDSIIVPKIVDKIGYLDYSAFIISPNPVKHELLIDAQLSKPYKIEIVNSLGQVIMVKSLSLNREIVNVSELPDGIYSLILKTGRAIAVQKFIKTSD